MRRRSHREINIFTVSFLDVLANTIGALTFLLLIAGILVRVSDEAPPKIVTEHLPDGFHQQDYAIWVAAREGMGQFSWTLGEGEHPKGLTLDAKSGKLSGNLILDPADGSEKEFHFAVVCATEKAESQGKNQTTTKHFTLLVHRRAPVDSVPLRILTTPVLPDGYLEQSFPLVLAAEGGQPPYSWAATGHLPSGLTLRKSGEFAGRPAELGTFKFDVSVATAHGEQALLGVTLEVAAKHPAPPPVPPLKILTHRLPPAVAEHDYALQLAAEGGAPPYHWKTVSPSPDWLKPEEIAGSFSGRPAPGSVGTSEIVWELNDSGGRSIKTDPLALEVLPPPAPPPPPLRFLTQSLPDARAGEPYAVALAVEGGFAPYQFSITGPEPTRGLTFTPQGGVFSGTPSSVGRVSLHPAVTDASGQSVSTELSLVIRPPHISVTILTRNPPLARAGTRFDFALAATGGFPPYHWRLAGGSLPPGIHLDESTGTLLGTPSEAGNWDVQVMAADAEEQPASESVPLSLLVLTPEGRHRLVITTRECPTMIAGEEFDFTLACEGGAGQYRWSAPRGLPSGLAIEQGRLAGVPSVPGSFNVDLAVSDDSGASATTTLAVRVRRVAEFWLAVGLAAISVIALVVIFLLRRTLVRSQPLPLRIVTESVPNARASSAYEVHLACEGGVAPYRWAVVTGTLPPGMELSPDGRLCGTPFAGIGVDATKDVRFSVEVTDSRGATARQEL